VSLVIRIGVADDPPLHVVAVRRLNGDLSRDPEQVSNYEVSRYYDSVLPTLEQLTCRAEVTHRYGDGALVLAAKALAAVTR